MYAIFVVNSVGFCFIVRYLLWIWLLPVTYM